MAGRSSGAGSWSAGRTLWNFKLRCAFSPFLASSHHLEPPPRLHPPSNAFFGVQLTQTELGFNVVVVGYVQHRQSRGRSLWLPPLSAQFLVFICLDSVQNPSSRLRCGFSVVRVCSNRIPLCFVRRSHCCKGGTVRESAVLWRAAKAMGTNASPGLFYRWPSEHMPHSLTSLFPCRTASTPSPTIQSSLIIHLSNGKWKILFFGSTNWKKKLFWILDTRAKGKFELERGFGGRRAWVTWQGNRRQFPRGNCQALNHRWA